jgi:hypothetical protein
LELKLLQGSVEGARYTLTIFLPEREVTTEAHIQAVSGMLELGPWQGEAPPAWLETVARALLRTVWRSATSDGDWPRRVTRWRPEPKS